VTVRRALLIVMAALVVSAPGAAASANVPGPRLPLGH
jgi:hypothetical protein